VVLGLKRLEQVDNIGVVTKTQMDTKLFGALINGKSGGAVDGGRALGDDLDGNMVTRYQVLGLEDHAKGAIVKRRDCFIPSIEYNACVKVIAHTLHEGCWEWKTGKRAEGKNSERSTRWLSQCRPR
jgi:hypothetical protein